MHKNTGLVGFAAVFAVVGSTAGALADSINVAVAANFTATAEKLEAAFEAESEHDVVLSFGASGALYTQITQAAPFQIFLSADAKRPAQAVTDGLGVEGSVFTYAIGKLALYSTTDDVSAGADFLATGDFQKVAIADPATAPYGAAAMEVLTALGLTEAITPKIVTGENISQTLQFVESASAEIGFVAASQVLGKPETQVFLLPADLYSPIIQDAVLLKTGEGTAAEEFFGYLKSDAAEAIIAADGYGLAE